MKSGSKTEWIIDFRSNSNQDHKFDEKNCGVAKRGGIKSRIDLETEGSIEYDGNYFIPDGPHSAYRR